MYTSENKGLANMTKLTVIHGRDFYTCVIQS